MREYTVQFEGKVIGSRKSAREYTHAIVATRVEDGKARVLRYARTEQLARQAAARLGEPWFSRVFVVPVEAREIATTWMNLKTRAQERAQETETLPVSWPY